MRKKGGDTGGRRRREIGVVIVGFSAVENSMLMEVVCWARGMVLSRRSPKENVTQGPADTLHITRYLPFLTAVPFSYMVERHLIITKAPRETLPEKT